MLNYVHIEVASASIFCVIFHLVKVSCIHVYPVLPVQHTLSWRQDSSGEGCRSMTYFYWKTSPTVTRATFKMSSTLLDIFSFVIWQHLLVFLSCFQPRS